MRDTRAFVGALALLALAFGPAAASAQSLGSFTWQLQPFCNRLTVTVTQNGAIYTLDGYDDQCGAPQRAPLVGMATPNPDGSIGLGFHVATSPGGKTVSVEARISLTTVGGPWTDSAGNSGTLVLNGAAGGSPRPAPPAPGISPGSVTAAALAPGAVTSAAMAVGAVTAPAIATGAVGSAAIANGSVGAADIDAAEVQRRVITNCRIGTFYSAVASTGTATCSQGTALANSVALGDGALGLASSTSNTAIGVDALGGLTTGSLNTAVGGIALQSLTTGSNNTGVGSAAAFRLTVGADNSVFGRFTATNATSAFANTVAGAFAAPDLTSGGRNLILGYAAGAGIVTGTNNILVDTSAPADESATIRIGRSAHTRAFIAGVRGVVTSTPAVAVVVGTDGQLGTVSSSRRFKQDIADMGDFSARLASLRPVTFRYRQPAADGSQPLDFGLIAEEVAEVFPELAVRGADGQIETVAYHKLPALLLNELQKQQRDAEAQRRQIEELLQRVQSLEATRPRQ